MDCFIDGARTPEQRRLAACIERWCAASDRRAHFAAGYAMAVDSAMAVARAGRYVESKWVQGLLAEWAEFYLITVDPPGDDLTLVTPPAWREAHSAASMPTTEAAEALMLGMNAHLNNDLPQALACELSREWPLPGARLERRRADFDKLLDVVADAVDGVQCLVSRFDQVLAPQRRGLSSALATAWDVQQLARSWREDIWQNAIALTTAVDETWSSAIREAIECTAARRAHLLMCPIAERDDLVLLPAGELDKAFPLRHRASACRLAGRPPVWGGQVPAAAF